MRSVLLYAKGGRLVSTQVLLSSGGTVSVAAGRTAGTIRLDLIDETGQHAWVFLDPIDAARIGAELLRRAGPAARLEVDDRG